MNKENRQMVIEEYLDTSKKASSISRWLAAGLSILFIHKYGNIGLMLAAFWTLDILQYWFLSARAYLVLKGHISIRTSNKLGPVCNAVFITNLLIIITLLWI